MKNRYLWLLLAFFLLIALLAAGLTRNPRDLPSTFIGKPAPPFELPMLTTSSGDGPRTFSPADMRGQVWLLNVWASWCISCREEHALLVNLASQKRLPIIGLNYKEIRGDAMLDTGKLNATEEMAMATKRAQQWLTRHGNPYQASVFDLDGQVGIEYGVYGVPESYLIDKQGNIRLKHTGPLTPDILQTKLLPIIQQLAKE